MQWRRLAHPTATANDWIDSPHHHPHRIPILIRRPSRPRQSAQPAAKFSRQPIGHGMPPLDIHHDGPSFQPHPIRGAVRAFHILLVFVLHEGVAATAWTRGVGRGRGVGDQFDILDGTVHLELAQQFAFGDFVGQPSHEEGVVAIHAVGEFAAAIALLFSVFGDEGRELGVVPRLGGAAFLLAQTLRRGVELARRGGSVFEVWKEGGYAAEAGAAF